MRAFLLGGVSAALLCVLSTLGMAADLAVPQKEVVMPTKAPAAEAVCLRWVEQNYSWYNYCDPIPYYPRKNYYNRFGELF